MRSATVALKVVQGAAVLGLVCALAASRSNEIAALHCSLLEFDSLRFLMSHRWAINPAEQPPFALAWFFTCAYFAAAAFFGIAFLLVPAAMIAAPGPFSVRAVRRGFAAAVFLVPPKWISSVAGYSGIREERTQASEKAADTVLDVEFPPERLARLRGVDVVITTRRRGAGTERCLAVAGVGALLAGMNGYVLFAWPFRFGVGGLSGDGVLSFLLLSWCFCGSLCSVAICLASALLKLSPAAARG